MKKLLMTAVVALAAVFALSSIAAAARPATVAPAGEISSPSVGKLSFTSGEITIRCNVTLSGELEAEVADISAAGEVIGEVTGVEIRNCEGGSVRAVLALPWELNVESALGTLPNEGTGLEFSVDQAAFQLSVFGGFVNCLYQGDARALLATNDTGTNTYSTGGITSSANAVNRVSGALCPTTGRLVGSFTLSPQQTITVS